MTVQRQQLAMTHLIWLRRLPLEIQCSQQLEWLTRYCFPLLGKSPDKAGSVLDMTVDEDKGTDAKDDTDVDIMGNSSDVDIIDLNDDSHAGTAAFIVHASVYLFHQCRSLPCFCPLTSAEHLPVCCLHIVSTQQMPAACKAKQHLLWAT